MDRIVAADSVRIIGIVMNSHLTKARLLEDCLCLLSNIAFVSDEIRLSVGRSVTGTIVDVTRVFNKVRRRRCGATVAVRAQRCAWCAWWETTGAVSIRHGAASHRQPHALRREYPSCRRLWYVLLLTAVLLCTCHL